MQMRMDGDTPLSLSRAAAQGLVRQESISKGADKHAADASGLTALHDATSRGLEGLCPGHPTPTTRLPRPA